ncbi:Pr6Pr family membrane protein [Pseudomonas gingeri]|uniref:Pr6Pr family membrane protein n=1 Tax=Pseudomonas gingeri TaxID=117681 RepID=A0A7Y8CLR5_9PSED|nr:Pr6Pr family membrane protein [Pseudomonas gingeri]NWB27697.1 Pr6Pr family membrane protein [Pseudomonas gingeri]NWC34309.1 Pr6Pr family membrane protein [Pseudomonas gingeri]
MGDEMLLTQGGRGTAVKIAALLGWLTLLLQLYLILASRWQSGQSLLGGVDIFFSYFTVLTNLLVAIVLTCAATSGDSALHRFFLKPTVQSGVAASIVLVGLAYNLLLRETWSPEGLQWVADELLHDVMPVLFVIYWWFCVPKGTLHWRDLWPWLLYPAVYFIYALVRGHLVGSYPYPFIEVDKLGYPQVFINAAMILVGFVAVSVVVIAVDRWRGKRDRLSPAAVG